MRVLNFFNVIRISQQIHRFFHFPGINLFFLSTTSFRSQLKWWNSSKQLNGALQFLFSALLLLDLCLPSPPWLDIYFVTWSRDSVCIFLSTWNKVIQFNSIPPKFKSANIQFYLNTNFDFDCRNSIRVVECEGCNYREEYFAEW